MTSLCKWIFTRSLSTLWLANIFKITCRLVPLHSLLTVIPLTPIPLTISPSSSPLLSHLLHIFLLLTVSHVVVLQVGPLPLFFSPIPTVLLLLYVSCAFCVTCVSCVTYPAHCVPCVSASPALPELVICIYLLDC